MPIPTNRPISVLVADDHEIVREGFQTMLSKNPGIELVGQAVDGEELVKLALELNPDIIITDIRMPKMDGVEATRIITEKLPAVGVIAFTMFDEEDLIVDMLEAGVQGYLLKSSSKDDILEAIRVVREGRTYYCRSTTPRMAHIIASSRHQPGKMAGKTRFSDKEIAIIRLICQELSNKEIASQLGVSIRTVEGHRERIQDKMKIRNTAGIVVYAIKEGIYTV